MTTIQKLFASDLNYFDVNEKGVKKVSICTPYQHFQLSDFTFNDPTINNMYNVKLNKNMNLIEQTYNWH